MDSGFKKITATPAEIERIFGIPRGTLANLRWQKKGPTYYKAGARKVIYMVDDVSAWLSRKPVLTRESEEVNG